MFSDTNMTSIMVNCSYLVKEGSCCSFVCFEMVSLYSSGCSKTHYVDQTGFNSQMLGLKAWATIPGRKDFV